MSSLVVISGSERAGVVLIKLIASVNDIPLSGMNSTSGNTSNDSEHRINGCPQFIQQSDLRNVGLVVIQR